MSNPSTPLRVRSRAEVEGSKDAARRRRSAQPIGKPYGCGGRRPSPALLLLDVPQGVRLRRRALELATWRPTQGTRDAGTHSKWNVRDADGTLVLIDCGALTSLALRDRYSRRPPRRTAWYPGLVGGSAYTVAVAQRLGKPHLTSISQLDLPPRRCGPGWRGIALGCSTWQGRGRAASQASTPRPPGFCAGC